MPTVERAVERGQIKIIAKTNIAKKHAYLQRKITKGRLLELHLNLSDNKIILRHALWQLDRSFVCVNFLRLHAAILLVLLLVM